MNDIKNLLSQIKILDKKNNEMLDATGGRFNMFSILGVDHYENRHSAILKEFLNPKGSHALGDQFLKKFLEIVGIDDFQTAGATVRTEVDTKGNGRMDIFIASNKKAIVIENKIDAADQPEQLKRYNQYASQRYGEGNYKIIYLTPDGRDATKQSGDGVKYQTISYKDDIVKWLKQCAMISVNHPIVRETLNQYINHLNNYSGQGMNAQNEKEIIDIILQNVEEAKTIAAYYTIALQKMQDNIKSEVVSILKNELGHDFTVEPGSYLKNYSSIWIRPNHLKTSGYEFGAESFWGRGHCNGDMFVGIYDGIKNVTQKADEICLDHNGWLDSGWINHYLIPDYENEYKVNMSNPELIKRIASNENFKKSFVKYLADTIITYINHKLTQLEKHINKQ